MSGKRQIIPTEEWKGLCARYGFSQSESGCRELLCQYLEEHAQRVMKSSVLDADQHGKVTLKGYHARAAINRTPSIPKGSY